MASLIDWFIDSMASEDVIDLYFILSDMIDINLTEEERCEAAYYDSMSRNSGRHDSDDLGPIPMGKRVY